MFGCGIVGDSKNVPQYIMEIVDKVEKKYGFCLDAVYYKEAKQKDYYSGCYYPSKRSIELYFSPEKNDEAIFVVLHELAHAIQHLELPNTLTPRKKGKRRVVHNQKFFEIARELYIEFGVLETARNREYKRARKLMVE